MLQCVYDNSAACEDTQTSVITSALKSSMDIAEELKCPTSVRSPCVEVDDCVSVFYYVFLLLLKR